MSLQEPALRVCTVAVGAFTELKVLFDSKHVHRKEHKRNSLYQVVIFCSGNREETIL